MPFLQSLRNLTLLAFLILPSISYGYFRIKSSNFAGVHGPTYGPNAGKTQGNIEYLSFTHVPEKGTWVSPSFDIRLATFHDLNPIVVRVGTLEATSKSVVSKSNTNEASIKTINTMTLPNLKASFNSEIEKVKNTQAINMNDIDGLRKENRELKIRIKALEQALTELSK